MSEIQAKAEQTSTPVKTKRAKYSVDDHPFIGGDRVLRAKHGEGVVLRSITVPNARKADLAFLIDVEIPKGKGGHKVRTLVGERASDWNKVFTFPTAESVQTAVEHTAPQIVPEILATPAQVAFANVMSEVLGTDVTKLGTRTDAKSNSKKRRKETFPTKGGAQKAAKAVPQFNDLVLLEGFEFGDRQFVKVGNSTAIAVPILSADHEPFVCLATADAPINSNSKVRFRKTDLVARLPVSK